MKRQRQGFQFRGFVALADTLFAVSAGLLLLNPIRFEPKSSAPPPAPEIESPPPPTLQPIAAEIQGLEARLDNLDADGRYLRQQAAEVLRNE